MIALARSSCSRATASSPRVASSACSRERSSPISAGAVSGAGWSSAVARRAQPPMLLTTRAPRRMSPPCSISFWVVVCIALSLYAQAVPYWHRPINSPSISRVAPPVPPRATRLLEQSDLLDLHRPVRRLHHVVNREQGDRHRRERLHFHARPPDRLRGGPYPHSRQRIVQRRVDFHVVQAQRVAQRNQLGRPLRGQRPRHLAHRQHVALCHLLIGDEPERLTRHPDRAFRHRRSHRDGLVAHIHHPRPARFVHMRQLHAGSARSSANTAPTSCGFTFPCARPRASRTRAIASTTFSVSPPARACSRSRSSRPSSMSVNPPRAWKGCRPSANPYLRTGPASTAARNRSAPSAPFALPSPSARSLPMRPSASATRCANSRCPVTPSSCCTNAATTLSANRAIRTRTTRDRIVGSSESGAAVVRMNTVSAGGSSNAFSNALAAASAPVWGTRRSASPIKNTLRRLSAGVSARRRSNSRTAAIPWLANPEGGSYSGCSRRAAISSPNASATSSTCLSASPPFLEGSSGTNQCTSGCDRLSTSLQCWHFPQPSPAIVRESCGVPCPASHTSACASQSARRCFPTPGGPSSRRACGNRPEAIAPASRCRVPS